MEGGIAIDLAEVVVTGGGHWLEDGAIVYGDVDDDNRFRLYRISSDGGERVAITGPSSSALVAPFVLPGARAALVMTRGQVHVVGLDGRAPDEPRVLAPGVGAKYLPSGHLVFGQPQGLVAARFGLESLVLSGPVVPIDEGGMVSVESGSAGPVFGVSKNGDLVYLRGDPEESRGVYRLQALDRQGQAHSSLELEGRVSLERRVSQPRVSPTGDTLVYGLGGDLWLVATDGESSPRQLTYGDERDGFPVWSPDGERIYFQDQEQGLAWLPTDGSAARTLLGETGVPYLVTRDGELILLRRNDLFALDLASGDVRELLSDRGFLLRPALSPDGRWLAFQSDQSEGIVHVFVVPFPAAGRRR